MDLTTLFNLRYSLPADSPRIESVNREIELAVIAEINYTKIHITFLMNKLDYSCAVISNLALDDDLRVITHNAIEMLKEVQEYLNQ